MKGRTWANVSRALAAVIGGYALTYAITLSVARCLPVDAVDAVIISVLPAFAVYLGLIVWIFSRPSALRAWGVSLWAVPLMWIGFWPQLSGLFS